MQNYQILLEYNKIKTMLADCALSESAKEKLLALTPLLDERLAKLHMNQTTAARRILDAHGNPPLAPMDELEKSLTLAATGAMLAPEQLTWVKGFLTSCARLQSYLKKAEDTDDTLAGWDGSFAPLPGLQGEIDLCIAGSGVDSAASPALRNLRRKIQNATDSMQGQLVAIANSKREFLSDGGAVQRHGRYVLPVKRAYKSKINGTVVDISGSGGTVFIEPASVARLQQSIAELRIEEENEVRKILYTLTALVDEHAADIKRNMQAMETVDILFAKAKLSAAMKASPVQLTTERRMDIRNGQHPLIPKESCVPLGLYFGGDTRGVVITGPNTGGKTVCMKTVGLLHIMAQSGLHVTASPDSVFCLFANYLCDIGDGQSITENLSTFSAHVTNIIQILENATPESLILLDELGSGTDPAEGMGIAVAVLDALLASGAMFLVTTHYPELKAYAERHPAILNARMAFDRESLAPTYRLEPGKSGESCALYIAQRLGFPQPLLERARQAAYPGAQPTVPEIPSIAVAQKNASVSHLRKETAPKPVSGRAQSFGFGDSVQVYPGRQAGIVFHTANDRGEIGVQIQGVKKWIPHKRLKIAAKAADLYPPDYDFSVIFDSVATRKAHKKIEKGQGKGIVVELEKEIWQP